MEFQILPQSYKIIQIIRLILKDFRWFRLKNTEDTVLHTYIGARAKPKDLIKLLLIFLIQSKLQITLTLTPSRHFTDTLLNAAKCNRMQQNATECNRMQQNATECNRMQQNATECNRMQQNATECNRMQQNATECNRMQQNATECNRMQQNATKCNNRKVCRLLDATRSTSYNNGSFVLRRGQRAATPSYICCILLH